jgi:hypothetical protein
MPVKPSDVIGHLLGWSELTRMHSYDYFMAPKWHSRIGKVTPKREYIRYLVQRERDRRSRVPSIASINARLVGAAKNNSIDLGEFNGWASSKGKILRQHAQYRHQRGG